MQVKRKESTGISVKKVEEWQGRKQIEESEQQQEAANQRKVY